MNIDNNDELKEIVIKNRTCFYFNDIIKIEVVNLDNILIDEKSCENILVYNISYQPLINAKPLRIRFDKTDGFIRVYDGTTGVKNRSIRFIMTFHNVAILIKSAFNKNNNYYC